MEAVAITIAITLLTVAACLMAWIAHRWRQRALSAEAFINNPNVKARDKEIEYKDSYERLVNALEDERRQQHEAIIEVFDYLNSRDNNETQLQQCRNVLLVAIQNSSYGRGDGANSS